VLGGSKGVSWRGERKEIVQEHEGKTLAAVVAVVATDQTQARPTIAPPKIATQRLR
jgi:hypothetical protein